MIRRLAQAEIVDYYTRVVSEDSRTETDIWRFEFERTKEIIARHLDRERPIILDLGGASGAYSFWLARLGYQVHLVDLVPKHVAEAGRKQERDGVRLASLQVADARMLPFPDAFADLVLLMGPLYHLTEREDRIQALREAVRVVKEGGRVVCAAISRFASMLEGFRSRLFDDPEFEAIVDQDLQDGRHRGVDGKDYFTIAFFHHPVELRRELEEGGLLCESLIGVEGPMAVLKQFNDWCDGRGRYHSLALKYARIVEEEETLLGASLHLLAVGLKP
jgi:ubiquinone/menaquinone biosynthesis C-methylase UbiE